MIRKLLHIIATPREDGSRTLKVSKVFLENFRKRFSNCKIEELNVTQEALPQLSVKEIGGKYVLLSGKSLSEEFKPYWDKIEAYINQFLSADFYLLSTPMWNFGIPYYLKHYIDVIVQPQYLFRYGENGPEGLAKNKKMVVITSRGGDYTGEAKAYDFQEPYLRTVFGFVGITDIKFINAQPMDAGGEDVRKDKIGEAISKARKEVQKL